MLTGCSPAVQPLISADAARAWQYADLRVLDEADGRKPELDLIAAYARQSGADLEIRVDLLQSRSNTDFDLYLAVDAQPGGKKELPIQGNGDLDWEVWIGFPSGAPSTAVVASGEKLSALTPRLYRDLELDAAVVRLNRKELGLPPARLRFQIFLTAPGGKQVEDQSAVFGLDGLPPAPAPVLLAFWDTLPAQSPAQTLRRWNGAHTGPAGHRHGLAQILDAVESARVPAVLLDLKTPDSLAGLDQVNGLKQVQRLAARGLLTLPDAAFGDPAVTDLALGISREAGLRFGLPASPVAYSPLEPRPAGRYHVLFSRDPNLSRPVRVGGARIFPLADAQAAQPDTDGLALATRRAILNAAMQPSPPLTALGGDVQQTLWADADVAKKALGYIPNHPWMRAVNGNELLTYPAGTREELPLAAGCQNLLCAPGAVTAEEEELRAGLRQAIPAVGDADWRALTWLMYLRMTQPAMDAQRARLQAGYLGQVGYLLRAGEWLRQPADFVNCEQDLDWDGQPECILASKQLFTVLEVDGARLVLAVYNAGGKGREWIGPTSQFAVGLGAPDEWQVNRGPAGDPQVIPGGMADQPDAFLLYLPSNAEQAVTFHGPGGVEKIYRLAGSRIEIEYRGNGVMTTRLPLVLGAGAAREPGGGYRFYNELNSDGQGYQWWSSSEGGVRVRTDGALMQVSSHLDSFGLMRSPEDPDREYPAGHFLPYPVTVVQIQARGPFRVTIEPK